jgi:hypothetical protein
MSRTFELLQRTGKSRDLFEETAPASDARSDGPSESWAEPSPPNAGARRLRLDLEGVGREESLKFVRRVFLSQADIGKVRGIFRRRACSGHDMELRVRGTNACDTGYG